MLILRSLEELSGIRTPVVMAVGVFDGVHLGHQRVIGLCREAAAREQAQPWVMTFDPHPLYVVQPATAPLLLTSLPAKLDLLTRQNVAGVMVVPFTETFSRLEPETFLDDLMRRIPALRGIVIGENWRFGRQARGNVALLKTLATQYGFHVQVATPLTWGDQTVSSSRIREAVASGRLDDAAAMLGRPHAVRGQVIHGLKRGRRLGFPTANLDLRGCALPPPGIYAARVRHASRTHAGAVYLPMHPEPQHGTLEVHLIDFNGDLYGQELELDFAAKIRDDTLRFPNEADLIEQIRSDVRRIREILA